MSRLTIDTGTAGNPATGDSLRTAFNKVNTNFTELYAELGGDSLDAISFNNNTISTDITNANLILTGNGTGGVVIEDIEITGSTFNVLTTNNNLTLNTNGTGKVVINGISFPTADGTAGQVLKTDGAGNLSFTAVDPGSITLVGDDSTGTAVNIGETFKIAGAGSVTTSVSGDTITITGSASAQGITFVGDDSTGTRVSDGESFKIAGTQNITTAVSGDTLTITGPNLSSYATQSYVTSQGYITNSLLTIVGDDSTGVTLNSNETIKIAGTSNITTAVSGDTLTITGPDLSSYLTNSTITVVGDDSTGTTLNTGETLKIAGSGSITTAVSGDTLTITGSKDINVNSITSSDSSAIQINDAVNIQGGLTVNGNTFNFSNVGAYENTMYLLTAENNPNNSYWGFSASGGYGHFEFQGDIERMSGANLRIAEGGGALIDTVNGRRLIIHAGDAGDYNYADLYLKGANVIVETHGVYPGRGTFTVDGIQIQSYKISTNESNANLELSANGTGTIELLTNTNVSGTLTTPTIQTNNISSADSSAIQINDAVNVSGAGTFHGSVRFNAGYTEKINALSSSSTITVNCATASIHTVTLAVSTGFVISNLPTGGTVTLIITQGGSGSYTATFGTDGSTTVKFPGGAPTLSTAVSAIDVVTIFNDGTNYLGNIAKAYAA